MKTNKLIYRIWLGLFSLAIIGAVVNSILNYDTVALTFEKLGYPAYLIHVLGAAQIVGLILIISNKDHWYVEWVYAGFFMNFTLGCIAHLATNHGNGASAVFCLMLLWVTYIHSKKVRVSNKETENVIKPKPEYA
ncbi:DoxX family protein [Spongiimicrobium sp. 3-5]|uniref:DoxX family protein n=1 Tax=Spongiimicrobium sp. 3-5 TaxID=3332596 RepID=UPI00398103E4